MHADRTLGLNRFSGVKVMQDGRWLHRDLKPTNIGLIGPLRSVLLDVGTSRHIQAGGSLRPEPGTVGTVGYLAPELELEDYDHSIDIWSMGRDLWGLDRGSKSRLFRPRGSPALGGLVVGQLLACTE